MMRVLVTGASGFIGRPACAALASAGWEVHAAARRPIAAVPAEWHAVDLLDAAARHELIAAIRPSHLLHLAWEARHGYYWQARENLAWVAATLDLVDRFAAAGGERAVGVGTCAEYDWRAVADGDGVCREATTPCRPATLYGTAKLATFHVLDAFARRFGLSFAWARLFFVFGPHEPPTRLIPSVIAGLSAGAPVGLRNADKVRDFIDSDSAGDALARLLGSGATGAVNIGRGRGVRIGDVAADLARLLGRPLRLLPPDGPGAGEEPPRLVADIARLTAETGFSPPADLDAALLRCLGTPAP